MKKVTAKFWTLIILACIVGFILAKIDTSKNWDDTGITVGLIVVTSFLFGFLMPIFAWLWAIVLGGFVFCFNVILSTNYESAGAILFAFVGAYVGVLFSKLFYTAAKK